MAERYSQDSTRASIIAGVAKTNQSPKLTPKSLHTNKIALLRYSIVRTNSPYLASPARMIFGPVPVRVPVPPILAE